MSAHYQRAAAAGKLVELRENRILYHYTRECSCGTSEHFFINKYEMALVDEIQRGISYSPLEWWHAQLLFWGLRERHEGHGAVDNMRTGLLYIVHSKLPMRGVQPQAVWDSLRAIWARHWGASGESVANQPAKRRRIENKNSSAPVQKQGRDSGEITMMGFDGIPRLEPQPERGPEVASETESELIEDQTAIATDGQWANHMKQIKKYREIHLTQLYTGVFLLRCPLIEERYPGLEGQLRFNVHWLSKRSVKYKAFEVHLDLGILQGTAVISTSRRLLTKYCLRRTNERLITEYTWDKDDAEICRVQQAYVANTIDDEQLLEGSQQEGLIKLEDQPVQSRSTTSEPLEYYTEYRLCDIKNLFSKTKRVFGGDGTLTYSDITGLQFKGSLNLPMLSKEPTQFEGFKIAANIESNYEPWATYDTSQVRYGAAWNKA